jgi:hypothetical protein
MRLRGGTSAGFMWMPRRPSLAVLFGLPLVGALAGGALGWAIARDDGRRGGTARASPGATSAMVASGDVRVMLPQGWTPVRGRARLPGFDDGEVALVRGWNVDVVLAELPARHHSLLPPALMARAGKLPRPATVKVGARRAQRYAALRLAGGTSVDVYVTPTTRGTVTWVCWSATSMRGECDVVLPRIRLVRGRFLPIGRDAAFLEGLPPAIERLNLARSRWRAALGRAATPDGGLRAARLLAAAYETAAADLRPLVTPASAASRTVTVLERLGRQHRRLAATLRVRARPPFRRLARAIRGDEAVLARKLQRWQRVLGAPGERP